jgi:hypothetical protein
MDNAHFYTGMMVNVAVVAFGVYVLKKNIDYYNKMLLPVWNKGEDKNSVAAPGPLSGNPSF